MKKKIISFFFFYLLFLGILALPVAATENNQGMTVRGITVEPILPKNQEKSIFDYFSLKMAPGDQQTIKVKLTNLTADKQQYEVKFNPARTNENGLIIYSQEGHGEGGITEWVSLPNIVEVPGERTVELPVTITMPNEVFNGKVLGGIQFVPVVDTKLKTSGEEQKNAQLTSLVTYTVALELYQTNQPVKSIIQYKNGHLSNRQNKLVVAFTLENSTKGLIEDIRYDVEVMDQELKTSLVKTSKNHYRFAPESDFTLTLPWDENYPAGTYQVFITAKSKVTNDIWEWQESFEITEKEYVDSEAHFEKKTSNQWFWIIVSLFFATLLMVIVIYCQHFFKQRKRRR